MSVSVDSGGGPGHKRLDVELNLVPYVDLLTCMVTFLLITAVWTQLAGLPVGRRAEGGGEPPPVAPQRLVVAVHPDGFALVAGDGAARRVALRDGGYDWATLLTLLQETHRRFPDRRDLQVAADDGVGYEQVVRVIDTALAARFEDVGVTDLAAARL